MLSLEDNERLTRVGPGTPMGELLRRYWLPFLVDWELPHPDCDPVRVKLLGEQLVAFRDTSGTVGLLATLCAHRKANLFFGRNEAHGLRCTYHGWKYDVHGNCVDMPTETEDGSFKDKIHLTSYPVREAGGVLWAYMGPPSDLPQLPEFEFTRTPAAQRFSSWAVQESNFVQAIEGGIDSVHTNFLHSSLDSYYMTEAWREEGKRTESIADVYKARDTMPKFFVKDTDYGLVIAARRETGEDSYYWRFNNFLMPFYTNPPVSTGLHAFVPIDDEHTMRWTLSWSQDKPYTIPERLLMQTGEGFGLHTPVFPGTHNPIRNKSNDYMIDRAIQRTMNFTGIRGQGDQDSSVQEQMGAITDRSDEHLGTTDLGIIHMRRMLLAAATAVQEGASPLAAHDGAAYRVRGNMVVLPREQPWEDTAREAVRQLKY